MRWAALLFIFSCSAPDLSVRGLEGCHSAYSTPGDECGPVAEWETRCGLPLAAPADGIDCFAPNHGDLSSVWCCSDTRVPPP